METPTFGSRTIRAVLSAFLAVVLAAAMIGGSTQPAAAADGKHFYWSNLLSGGIGRAAAAPPNAATPQFIEPNHPDGRSYALASDGEYIYWSEVRDESEESEESGESKSYISRAPINNPTAVEKKFITVTEETGAVYSIAITGSTIGSAVVVGDRWFVRPRVR